MPAGTNGGIYSTKTAKIDMGAGDWDVRSHAEGDAPGPPDIRRVELTEALEAGGSATALILRYDVTQGNAERWVVTNQGITVYDWTGDIDAGIGVRMLVRRCRDSQRWEVMPTSQSGLEIFEGTVDSNFTTADEFFNITCTFTSTTRYYIGETIQVQNVYKSAGLWVFAGSTGAVCKGHYVGPGALPNNMDEQARAFWVEC